MEDTFSGEFSPLEGLRVLDLSDEKEHQIVIERTKEAIQSDNINVIYEAGFLFKKTFIRADVLIKKDNQWTMLEAKASTSVKDINISDLK